jgi:hypothetical protein
MRCFIILLMLCLLSLPTSAQEGFPVPSLPDEPIFVSTDREVVQWAELYQFAWLDNQNLVFTFSNITLSSIGTDPNLGYSYNVQTDNLTLLENSPFVSNWDEDKRAFFQAGNYIVHHSPYPNQNGIIPIVYESTLYTECGSECIGTLIMYGNYQEDGASYHGYYDPLSIHAQTGINIHWSRNNNAILMEMGGNFSAYIGLHWVDLSTSNLILIMFSELHQMVREWYLPQTDFSQGIWTIALKLGRN